ncbi:NAD(P)/FAD-dependent oxidoreductase [Agromyces archimandritae]|uniref:FAD-dependent oxidoreductase n=1 Tax=Agromyces archimandritae TaxID=2781962 RepID=A0A975FKX5_9MICO|nr:FAD-dependent oxidoreductase [Agromyces archimandritae]QTX04413.1 FAD-dependent oxidoreductase [Agromyces archimandritae]
MREIVIVGGSVAAVTAADALRQFGHDGPITVLSAESHAPYVRPPLSKAVLKGAEEPESVRIAGAGEHWTLRLDAPARGLDRQRKRVLLGDDEEVPYDGLVIATGARARRLLPDGSEHVVRDLDDSLRLRERIGDARSMLVIGGGFLGMEIASSARDLGLEVTVVDMIPHLERQFGPYLAAHMTAAAAARGVRLVVEPGGIEFLDARPLAGVRAASGAVYEADIVVSAVGDLPNVEWLAGAGLDLPTGIETDARCRVAPDIVAIGDVAAVLDARTGQARRSPHWGAAIDQARVAAGALLLGDAAEEYASRPYFWTDQWGLDMKICGAIGTARPEFLEGSLEDGQALIRFRDDAGPVAAVSVNRRVPIPRLRKLAAGLA